MARLRINLIFEGSASSTGGFIAFYIQHTEQAVYSSEVSDLYSALAEIPEIPTVAQDAAMFRINRYRGSAVRVVAVRSGSVVVELAPLALAYWILDKTVGETVKEAWRESNLHNKLKRFFLNRQRTKLPTIQDALREPFREMPARMRLDTTRRETSSNRRPDGDYEPYIETTIRGETLEVIVEDFNASPIAPKFDDLYESDPNEEKDDEN